MFVIFSDLDRCLLDNWYRFDTVKPTVDRLLEEGHHLIFNSSKTRSEICAIQEEMGLRSPFIVENGSAIFIPKDYLSKIPILPTKGEYLYLELGKPHELVSEGMEIVQSRIGPVDSFSSLSIDAFIQITGLTVEKARLARNREYSEPFIYEKALPEDITARLRDLDLRILKGASFCHLLGPTDKGLACGRLIHIMKEAGISFISVGIGDDPNDLPMLENVDIPFLTQLGPEGWKIFVTKLLETNHG